MTDKIKHFKDLEAWKASHELVVFIYQITNKFPKSEIFGLTNQMRRCAVSVSSNIAEGFARKTNKDKQHFYYISKGSLFELQNQIIIATDIEYMDTQTLNEACERVDKVNKLLCGLIKFVSR